MRCIGEAKIDWEAIQTEYVTTKVSQKQLSEKYGVSRSAIQYRCAVERWGEKRRQHQDRIMEKTTERLSDEAADRMVVLMGGTDKMLSSVLEVLDDPEQFYRHLVTVKEDGATYTQEETFQKADTKAMKDVTIMLEKLTGLTRDLYGLPTREQELAEERMKLELEKLQSSMTEQGTIQVVFDAGEDAWNE